MPKRRYTTSLTIDPQTGKQVFKIEKTSASSSNGVPDENYKSNSIKNDDIISNRDTYAVESVDSKPGWWKWLGW